MEEDLIIGEEERDSDLDIIESQLSVIANVMDVDSSVYDQFDEDRVKVVAAAMKIIFKVQKKLLKN